MKKGIRALGVAESYRGDGGVSYLAGAVVRGSRVTDGFRFTTTTVGGTDSTESVVELYEGHGREDIRFILVSGIAPAWYNIIDLRAVEKATGVPVVSVTYEEGGERRDLRSSIEDEFEKDRLEKRIRLYESLPERRRLVVEGNDLYIRSLGVSDDRADEWIHGFTYDGRPEPVRVARLAARGLLSYEETPRGGG